MGECGCTLEVARCSEHADDVVLVVARDDLERVDEALRSAAVSAIAHYASEPYEDDPQWSPWSRFGKPVADRCTRAREILRRAESGVS